MKANHSLLNSIRQYYLAGRFQDAVELCLEGLANTPDSTELHFLMAMCDERVGRVNEALERFERVVQSDRSHVHARFALGRILAERGRHKEARQHLNSCLELDPSYAPARTIRARLDFVEGRASEAISGLKTALRAEPNHLPALVSLAEVLLEQGDAEAAHDYASQALQLAPEDASAQLVNGRVFLARDMFAFAERCLDNAAQRDPSNPHVHVATGELMQRLGRHEEAAAQFSRARNAGLDSRPVLRGLAASLGKSGRLQEASQLFGQIVPTPADSELVLDMADLHALNNDAPAVSALAQRCQDLPEEIRQWLEVLTHRLSGDFEAASELAGALLEADDIEVQARARLLSGKSSLHKGDQAAVVSALSPILQEPGLAPNHVWEMARLLREAGSPELADQCLEHLVERKDIDEQTRSRTQVMRLDLLDHAGRYDEAASLFESAAWRSPYLGEPVYRSAGADPDKALAVVANFNWSGAEAAAESDQATPVFITGWPYAGRDLVLAAISQSDSVDVLSLGDWPQRKHHLGLPVNLRHLNAEGSERLHLMRRRYARYCLAGKTPVESAVVHPVDLVQLARLYPGATVVHVVAPEKYLGMQWRLSGYRQVEEMLSAWSREQAVLARLKAILPLQHIDVSLERLLSDRESALSELCESVGLDYQSNMNEVTARIAASRGYRAPDHWMHYSASDG